MNHSKHNSGDALTIRGVLGECARSEPVSKLVARYFLNAGFLLLLFTVMYCLMWMAADYQEFVSQPITVAVPERSKAELKSALKYHGVNYAWRDGDVWYFYRDGARCRLFAYKERSNDS
jgi:hypothetical protein